MIPRATLPYVRPHHRLPAVCDQTDPGVTMSVEHMHFVEADDIIATLYDGTAADIAQAESWGRIAALTFGPPKPLRVHPCPDMVHLHVGLESCLPPGTQITPRFAAFFHTACGFTFRLTVVQLMTNGTPRIGALLSGDIPPSGRRLPVTLSGHTAAPVCGQHAQPAAAPAGEQLFDELLEIYPQLKECLRHPVADTAQRASTFQKARSLSFRLSAPGLA